MKYGICTLSLIPLRAEAANSSELVTQILYGELFKILESRKTWSRIRLAFDGYEGWLDNKQFRLIEEEQYNDFSKQIPILSEDLVDMVTTPNKQMLSIVMGSSLNTLALLDHLFDGRTIANTFPKQHLIETALLYLNTPYL